MEEKNCGNIEGFAKITFGTNVRYRYTMSEDKKSVTFEIFETDENNNEKPTQVKLEFNDLRSLGFFRYFISARYNEMFGKNEQREKPTDSIGDIRAWIREAKDKLMFPMTRKDVKKRVFGDIGGQRNSTRQQNDLAAALKANLLKETCVKSNGYYMLTDCGV